MRPSLILLLAAAPYANACAQEETPPKTGTAEAIRTARLQAEEGAASLEEQLPADLLPGLLVARLIGPDGKPADGPAPQTEIREDGRVACTWTAEIYFDTKRFYEEVAPELDAVLAAAAGDAGNADSESMPSGKVQQTGYPIFGPRNWTDLAPEEPEGNRSHAYVLLSAGRSAHGGTEHFRWYRLDGTPYVEALGRACLSGRDPGVMLSLALLDEDDGVIWSEAVSPWERALITDDRGRSAEAPFLPYFLTPAPIEGLAQNAILSPRFGYASTGRATFYNGPAPYGPYGHCDTIVRTITAVLPPEDVDRIAKARLSFARGTALGE